MEIRREYPRIEHDFANVPDMLQALQPVEPVYCVYPHVLSRVTREFLQGFPGTVMYAVKANPAPMVLQGLIAGGLREFDTASVPEMELVHEVMPGAICHFMAPVKLPGAAARAYTHHSVRSFVVDHESELERLLDELPGRDVDIFVRLAAHDSDATYDLSTKFGAYPDHVVALLRQVQESGARAALSFNVGSLVLRPGAYLRALEQCQQILKRSAVPVRKLDVGGGFPAWYPDVAARPVQEFFSAIGRFAREIADTGTLELLAEPGRALVAEGMSVVTRVLLRKDDRLYMNDGVWGSFIEPVISKGLVRYPTRVFRKGSLLETQGSREFTLFGPTCDSLDVLPRPFYLPANIQRDDWIEFGNMGAYSLTNRTGFNGFYPNTFARLDGADALPPAGASLGAE
ncbi:MAG: type III PLP-dependent enzyme [Gammaproteobacteria bacterium]|nr:type III PLP-dependent enzyme [Gammaproteobacteria bacterium]